MGKLADALKRPGFDCVFDTNFSTDLTIMEEGSEFIERFTHRGKRRWPIFTSRCPGWVRLLKTQFLTYTGNLSTAKSPGRCSARWPRKRKASCPPCATPEEAPARTWS